MKQFGLRPTIRGLSFELFKNINVQKKL